MIDIVDEKDTDQEKKKRDPRSGTPLEDFSPKTGSARKTFMFMGTEAACQEFTLYFARRNCTVRCEEEPVLRYFVDIRPRFRQCVYRELSRLCKKGISRGDFSDGYLVTQEEVLATITHAHTSRARERKEGELNEGGE